MRSLRSVDDIVAALHGAVKAAGQLDRTYFFFTSDHGLHMGQFCLGPCKRQPYDTDLRIPCLAVGPGIAPGPLAVVASIPDLAPTFLELCGAQAAIAELQMDGRSLMPLLRSTARSASLSDRSVLLSAATDEAAPAWRTAHLVEYIATSGVVSHLDSSTHLKDNSNNTFIGLRILNASMNLAYFEFTDATIDWAFADSNFCEMYDLAKDPHQLSNICSRSSPSLRAELHAQLWQQYTCHGPTCN